MSVRVFINIIRIISLFYYSIVLNVMHSAWLREEAFFLMCIDFCNIFSLESCWCRMHFWEWSREVIASIWIVYLRIQNYRGLIWTIWSVPPKNHPDYITPFTPMISRRPWIQWRTNKPCYQARLFRFLTMYVSNVNILKYIYNAIEPIQTMLFI